MSVSFCIHGSPSPPPGLYRFPIERYTRSYREKSTYTRITSFVRARRVILYRSNFNTFFFSPPPLLFFRYIIGATGLRFLCDTSVCPTFDTRDVQIDSIETIFLPFFPPCYTRNAVSKSLPFDQAERDIVKNIARYIPILHY